MLWFDGGARAVKHQAAVADPARGIFRAVAGKPGFHLEPCAPATTETRKTRHGRTVVSHATRPSARIRLCVGMSDLQSDFFHSDGSTGAPSSRNRIDAISSMVVLVWPSRFGIQERARYQTRCDGLLDGKIGQVVEWSGKSPVRESSAGRLSISTV